MPSVVIPAYNEANGIERCIRAVLRDGIEDLVVVVVPNACRDDTAARARSFGASVLVAETAQGGKTNAINLGERTLREHGRDLFPRLFLDGDIELEAGTLRALFAAAAATGTRVVAAQPRFDAARSDFLSRCFYDADRFNPYHLTTAPNGGGTYCVNAESRARWGEFPNIIADDSFVERHFAASERKTLLGSYSIVRVPRTYAALRGVSARKREGACELEAILPLRRDQHAASGTFRVVARALLPLPHRWPSFAVWAFTKWLERVERGKIAAQTGTDRWQQDTSSRS